MLDRQLFLYRADDLLRVHGSRLRELCGKTVEATWVAWDEAEDTWLQDEAVILRIGADNLEIVCWKLDEIALNWNAIDVSARSAWVLDWDEQVPLRWRRDAMPMLANVVGKTVTGVSILEYLFESQTVRDEVQPENIGRRHQAWLLHGIELKLGQQRP